MEDTDSLDPALPWWLGQLSSPLHQKSHHQIWGEEQNHLGCLSASQGARGAPTEADGSLPPRALLLTCKGNRRQPWFTKLPPLPADKT